MKETDFSRHTHDIIASLLTTHNTSSLEAYPHTKVYEAIKDITSLRAKITAKSPSERRSRVAWVVLRVGVLLRRRLRAVGAGVRLHRRRLHGLRLPGRHGLRGVGVHRLRRAHRYPRRRIPASLLSDPQRRAGEHEKDGNDDADDARDGDVELLILIVVFSCARLLGGRSRRRAHEGCMLSSHTHASAFMSYGVPTRLDFTARSAYSVSPRGPSMAQAYASICASVQLA